MTRLNAKNNAETVLVQAVSESDTEIVVEDAGALPDVPFRLSVEDEIVEVSAVDGNTLTVERAVEDTQAGNYGVGTTVENRLTAGMYRELISEEEFASHKADYTQHINDDSAHGIGDKTLLETTEKGTIVGALNELFTNVSDGKKLIGGAITDVDEGVEVPADATFEQLSDAIGKTAGEMRKWAEGNHETTGRKGNDRFSIFYMPPVVFSPSIIILHAVNKGKVFVFEKTAEEWANIGAGDGRDPKGGKDDFSAVIEVPLNTDIHWLALE